MAASDAPRPLDPLDAAVSDIGRSASGWLAALRAVAALGATCTDEDWARATDLPGWSVGDLIAHVSGLEATNLGWPQPDHVLPEGLGHVRNDVGRFMELAVDVRRSWSRTAVLEELARVVATREAEVVGGLPAPDERIPGLLGRPMPANVVVSIRAFDVWVHEQDLRRALGRPGGLDGDGATAAFARIVSSLPTVAKQARLPEGRTVVLEVGTPIGRSFALQGTAEGAIRVDPSAVAAPDVRLAMTAEAFHRRACGRGSAADLGISVEGDRALAEAVLTALAFAP